MAPVTDWALGLDVGGTKIAAGLVRCDTGVVEGFEVRPTPVADGGEAVLASCVDLAQRVLAATGWKGSVPVGVGICELVDLAGHTIAATTIDWRCCDVSGAFAGVGPATLVSDVRAAAVAEAVHGAGIGQTPLLYLSVGTGISHCLVVDQMAYAGAHGGAILTGAPLIEDRAAGPAISREANRSTQEALTDPDCDGIVDRAASLTGEALAFLVNALDPAMVVVGGGLGLQARYRHAATARMREMAAPQVRDIVVCPAELGAAAGTVGAALVAARPC